MAMAGNLIVISVCLGDFAERRALACAPSMHPAGRSLCQLCSPATTLVPGCVGVSKSRQHPSQSFPGPMVFISVTYNPKLRPKNATAC